MRHFQRLFFSGLLIFATAFAFSRHPAHAQETTCPDSADLQNRQEAEIVDLVNKARAAAGMGPVKVNSLLGAAAQRQSNDMANKDFLDHTGSDGSTIAQRATDAKYEWGNLGENILYRFDLSSAGAYDQWWNSPPHKANMMNPQFTEIGVKFACTAGNKPKYYYTMVLAAPMGGANGDNVNTPTPAATESPTSDSSTDSNSPDTSDTQPTPTPES